jgi:iron complex transport system permease protein
VKQKEKDVRYLAAKRCRGILTIGIILIVITVVISLSMGAISISPGDMIRTLAGFGTPKNQLVLFSFRLPRLAMIFIVGTGMALSGALLQGITRNDLVDSGVMGINAGAGLFVVLYIFFSGGDAQIVKTTQYWMLPVIAISGGLLTAMTVYVLTWNKGISAIRLLLTGVAVNAVINALILIFQLKMNEYNFNRAMAWLSGDIWKADWPLIALLGGWTLILCIILNRQTQELDILRLGDEWGVTLGVKTEKSRLLLLLTAVAFASIAVAAGGTISFLGLLSPHIARRLTGGLSRYYLPVAACIGIGITLFADVCAKFIFSPDGIPIGLMVAMVGAPYFIYLIVKYN